MTMPAFSTKHEEGIDILGRERDRSTAAEEHTTFGIEPKAAELVQWFPDRMFLVTSTFADNPWMEQPLLPRPIH